MARSGFGCQVKEVYGNRRRSRLGVFHDANGTKELSPQLGLETPANVVLCAIVERDHEPVSPTSNDAQDSRDVHGRTSMDPHDAERGETVQRRTERKRHAELTVTRRDARDIPHRADRRDIGHVHDVDARAVSNRDAIAAQDDQGGR